MRRKLALVLPLLLLAGCLEDGGGGTAGEDGAGDPGVGDAPGTGEPAGPTSLATRELASGTHSGIEGGARRILDTQEAWEDFWREHSDPLGEPEPAPEVDFASEVVAAAILENKPNGCYAARITNATLEGTAVTLDLVTYTPPPDMMCISVVSQPFHFVALERAGDAQAYEWNETTVQGPPPEDG